MAENAIQQTVGSGKVAILHPVFQIFSNYRILNPQTVKNFTGTGGTVTSNVNNIAVDMDITTSVGSFALLRGVRVLKYRPGFANVVRFGAVFNAGVANSIQFAGLQNEGNQLTFAFAGTDFVTRLTSGGRLEARILTVIAETGAATATVTLDSVAFNVPLTNAGGDASFTAHEIATFTYAGWTTEHVDDTVNFISNAIVAPITGTFSYSSTGASTGSFVRDQAGVVTTTTDTLQADWNGNSEMVTKLNPLLFNTYEIEFIWLGGGNIEFRVLNPRDGKFETVHSMKFGNINTIVSIEQPNMFGTAGCISAGSTTAMTLTVSGLFGGTYGSTIIRNPIYGVANERTISAATETVILAIKNRFIVNSTINQSEVFIERMSAAVDGNRPVTIKIIKNPTTLSADTTGDYINYQFLDEANSLTILDTTALTFTGGSIVDEFFVGKDGSLTIDYNLREIEMFQNEIIIFTAESSLTNIVDLSVTLLEDA